MALTQEQLEYQRQWRKENQDLYKEQQRRSSLSQKKKINSDPKYFINHTFTSLRGGAEVRGYAFNLTKSQLAKIINSNTKCALSGRTLVLKQHDPNKVSIDRIDNRYGYSLKNCQAVSQQINKHRLDLSVEDFVAMCCDVAANHGWVRQDKISELKNERTN